MGTPYIASRTYFVLYLVLTNHKYIDICITSMFIIVSILSLLFLVSHTKNLALQSPPVAVLYIGYMCNRSETLLGSIGL